MRRPTKIGKIIENLSEGGAVIYPTETAYALGCDATNQKAVNLIFKIKHRPKNKPLPLIAGSLAMVKRYCRMSAAEERLARRYWPGPLTLILKNKEQGTRNNLKLARGVVAKDKTIAIRVSSNRIARELSRRLGRPIVSTSANLSGEGEAYRIEDLRFKIKRLSAKGGSTSGGEDYKILIMDGGGLPKRKPSTMVRLGERGEIEVLRRGEVRVRDSEIN